MTQAADAGSDAGPGAPRLVPRPTLPVEPATDLGGTTVLKAGRLVLLCDDAGDVVAGRGGLGLYAGDTRVVSCLRLLLDGRRPAVLRPDPGGSASGSCLLSDGTALRDPDDATGAAPPAHALVVERRRLLEGEPGAEALSEELALTSYGDPPRQVEVELLLEADMADIFEVRGVRRARRGRLGPVEVTAGEAVLPYEATDGRASSVRVRAPGAEVRPAPAGSGAAIVLRWSLAIEQLATRVVSWTVSAEGLETAPAGPARPAGPRPPSGRRGPEPAVSSSDPALDRTIARGLADLRLLETPGPAPGERFLAAGLPWFSALFGRDAIIASYAALPFDPAPAIDTLRVLARLQAAADDPARDAEPGKIPHEVRTGEMARTGEVVFGRYYGSVDATPLWLVLLGETFDWTGDRALVDALWPSALAALGWLEAHGDLDGDGFVESRRRAPHGLLQHGWKDAPDAIRDRRGRIAEGPVALCEVQGYAHEARLRLARLARLRGEEMLAGRLEADAARLRARFDEAFWVPDRESFALALDGAKRPMDAVGSNQGHALWSGIVAPERARAVAGRLLGPDMASGWGLRTYAAGQPGFSPMGYHTGAVWPHDTAIAVAGLARAGRREEAALLAAQLFEAARALPAHRLPELYAGFERGTSDAPVPYPLACAPQAWAAAAPLLALRALLGLRPDAVAGVLRVERPLLPPGVGRLRVEVRLGAVPLRLAFRRSRAGVAVEGASAAAAEDAAPALVAGASGDRAPRIELVDP